MKLSDYKKEYQDYSRSVSERARVATFAGIAIIWLFKEVDAAGNIHFDADLIWPLAAFVGAIVVDLLQYLLGTFIWYSFFKYQENKLSDKTEDKILTHPAILAAPIHWAFRIKLVFVGIGYFFLLKHILPWF